MFSIPAVPTVIPPTCPSTLHRPLAYTVPVPSWWMPCLPSGKRRESVRSFPLLREKIASAPVSMKKTDSLWSAHYITLVTNATNGWILCITKKRFDRKKHPRKRKFCGGALSNIRFLMPAGVFHMQSIFRKFPKEFISLKKAPAKAHLR